MPLLAVLAAALLCAPARAAFPRSPLRAAAAPVRAASALASAPAALASAPAGLAAAAIEPRLFEPASAPAAAVPDALSAAPSVAPAAAAEAEAALPPRTRRLFREIAGSWREREAGSVAAPARASPRLRLGQPSPDNYPAHAITSLAGISASGALYVLREAGSINAFTLHQSNFFMGLTLMINLYLLAAGPLRVPRRVALAVTAAGVSAANLYSEANPFSGSWDPSDLAAGLAAVGVFLLLQRLFPVSER